MSPLPASTYVWLAAVASVPVIIHLINLLQRRRVQWAAMEFLLASQRKHSTWIRIKELLLMLLRMLAVAAVVLIILPPQLDEALGKRIGGITMHHIVLLDDSYSMSDRIPEGEIFDQRAKAAVAGIALAAKRDSGNHAFTLLRASQAAAGENGSPKPDFFAEPVGDSFIADEYAAEVARKRDEEGYEFSKLCKLLSSVRTTESAAGAPQGIQALSSLVAGREGEVFVVHVVSDFRQRDWANHEELKKLLTAEELRGAPVDLVDCAKEQRQNLAVTSLKLKSRTYAAGVPFRVEVEITNFGAADSAESFAELRVNGAVDGLLKLQPIRPGEKRTIDPEIRLNTFGEHTVEVALAADAVAADNRRFLVIELPESMPCLVVQDPATPAAKPGEPPPLTAAAKIAEALAPRGPRSSGLRPELRFPDFLTTSAPETLAKYRAIYIVDVDRLDDEAVRKLEAYAAGGGGVVFVVGPHVDGEFYNASLYREGTGVFPGPLGSVVPLFRDPRNKSPDIVAGNHPIMKFFGEQRNAALNEVTVSQYTMIPADWLAEREAALTADKNEPPPSPEIERAKSMEIAATLRNGAPLIVEKPFGSGRAAAILADVVPPGSDWHRNFSFLIVVQELQTTIGRADGGIGDGRRVGTPLTIPLDLGDELNKGARFDRLEIVSPRAGELTARPTRTDEKTEHVHRETAYSGFYRIGYYRKKSDDDESKAADREPDLTKAAAFNVDAAEGDLARVGDERLLEKLQGLNVKLQGTAEELALVKQESAQDKLSVWILYALVGLLIGEQALAYSASYHPSSREEGP